MSMTIVLYIGKAAASELVEAGFKWAMGREVQGAKLEDHLQQLALAVFTGAPLHPEPSFETKAEGRFQRLEAEIAGLKTDIAELRDEVADFQWRVASMLHQAREENLWQTMLQIENSSDIYYTRIKLLGESKEPLETRKQRAAELADTILASDVAAHVANTRLAFLGDTVGAGKERVRGFLEIWKQQALREADLGWRGERLAEIFNVLEAKFTRAMLIQLKCARLMMEAYEARRQREPSHPGAADYFAGTFYPILRAEVTGFRDLVESLAINLLPLPDGALSTLAVPDEIAGMLAGLDVYTGQALRGKVVAGETGPGGRTLEGLPALSGCWGRVIVPGTRWIRRAPGSSDAARLRIQRPGGPEVICKGRVEVRAVDYTPYDASNGSKVHEGYTLVVNNTPREMDKMLLAQFVPEDVLPADLAGTLEVRLEDGGGETLAQTQALFVAVPLDEGQQTTVPYGTFTMTFTGGADVRRR